MVRLHAAINRADFRFCRMLMRVDNIEMNITQSLDDVDSVFFKYNLIKAESAQQIAACKRSFSCSKLRQIMCIKVEA